MYTSSMLDVVKEFQRHPCAFNAHSSNAYSIKLPKKYELTTMRSVLSFVWCVHLCVYR